MSIDTMTYAELSEFDGRHVIIYGADENTEALVHCIEAKHPSITIDLFVSPPHQQKYQYKQVPCSSLEEARAQGVLNGANIFVACKAPNVALNLFIDDSFAEIRVVSRQLHGIFHSKGGEEKIFHAQRCTSPFYLKRGTPKVKGLVANAYQINGPAGDNVFELADFDKQEFVTWQVPDSVS